MKQHEMFGGRIYVRGAVAALTLFLVLSSISNNVSSGIVPPRRGGNLPESYLAVKKTRKNAFKLRRGWIKRSRELKYLLSLIHISEPTRPY